MNEERAGGIEHTRGQGATRDRASDGTVGQDTTRDDGQGKPVAMVKVVAAAGERRRALTACEVVVAAVAVTA